MTALRKPDRDESEAPLEARRGARALALMRVALRLFAVKDASRITIKEIAQASGCDSALIYYYFRDKEDLFRSAVRFALREALDAKQRPQEEGEDPVQAIRAWLAHCLAMAEQNRLLFRIMFQHAGPLARSAGISELIEAFYASEEDDILAANIERGAALGLFRAGVDAAALSRFVSVHLDGITAASVVRESFDAAAAMQELERQLWQSLGYRPGRRGGRAQRAATSSSIGR
ncbi:MAG: TetR/AcrR family transcriptional regulator [Dongiaceae bacterium]